MVLAMEAPTWPAITQDEAEAVLARFPTAAPIEALCWHSPRPFSAATLIDTVDGALVLKRHDRRVRTVAGLAEEHAFIAHLASAGTSVPDALRTADGESAVAVGEWSYELHRRGAGNDVYRDRPSWTPFLSEVHAREAGIALARLHEASRGFDAPARVTQPLVASLSILSASDPLSGAEAYVDARPALAAFLSGRQSQRWLSSLFAATGDDLPRRLADQPPLWTHNDWHPSNLLWMADGTVETVFDFGLADRTCALHDLAIAIERTAFAWLELGQVGDDTIANPAAAFALLAGYEAIRPLNRDEIDLLTRLLPLVHVEFALSEIDYFAGIVGDPDAASLAWEGYLLGHADWFRSAVGKDFLTRLRAGRSL
ncbi:phosphotransferase enzyme family protein [Sphingomonas sp. Mn802worker]|uniref:phosphotransferase enzyme family protein n=1 Tax=Sphingomonas sp. Mn802worker TaxID=629773 RepID=UPI00037EF097|nr:phosphotransferase [Sphingomonas sp. Mn802worker]